MAMLNDATEREFRIVVHFGKEPGSFSHGLEVSVDAARGASLIRAPREAVSAVLQTTRGNLRVILNAVGEYAGLEYRCVARNRLEVLAKYSEVMAPLIDHLAFAHDVPVFVRALAWWDEKNRAIGASYVSPYESVTPTEDVSVFDDELRPFFALYREGITSGSVYYQFLCYSKILEGVFRWLVPRLREEAKAKGVDLPKLEARVEDHPHLEGDSRRFIGKGVEQTFNDHLQEEFRNAIAHFTTIGGDPMIVSNYVAGARVANNLFLARSCARSAIVAAERLVRSLKSATAQPAPVTPT